MNSKEDNIHKYNGFDNVNHFGNLNSNTQAHLIIIRQQLKYIYIQRGGMLYERVRSSQIYMGQYLWNLVASWVFRVDGVLMLVISSISKREVRLLSMVVRRKKILSQWIDTIGQKSNLIYTVGQTSKIFNRQIDTFSVKHDRQNPSILDIDPSIIRLKLSRPFSVLAILHFLPQFLVEVQRFFIAMAKTAKVWRFL